ncbi:Cactin [Aphelenchoides fujianensis]|nr:Cactin [Aphelenchoides fujianensis]
MGRHSRSRSRSGSFDRYLDDKRRESKSRRKEEKKKRKERENSEERRERRLDKKRRKDERAEDKVAKIELPGHLQYSDLNNPFNDANLTETFVWDKKLKTEGKSGLSKKEIEKMNRMKVEKNIAEMEELKRNRDARQSAREDLEMIARDEERRQYTEWRRTEEAFHLKQAKLRSKIRIKEGRPKPIDLLGRYAAFGSAEERREAGGNAVDNFDEYEEFELVNPTSYIKNLAADDLEDLVEDIKASLFIPSAHQSTGRLQVYRQIEAGKNADFWDDVTTLAKFDLKRQSNMAFDENIHQSVLGTVEQAFRSESSLLSFPLVRFQKKSFAELSKMEADITQKIRGAGRGVDVSYWEAVLEVLRPKMARTRLKEGFAQKQKARLDQIRAQQRKAMEKHESTSNFQLPSTSSKMVAGQDVEMEDDTKPPTGSSAHLRKEDLDAIEAYDARKPLPFTLDELEKLDDEHREQKWLLLNDQQLRRFTVEMYRAGAYSPTFVDEAQAMPGIEVVDEKEDVEKRRKVAEKDSKMMAIAKQGMTGEESSFAVEEKVDEKVTWADKLRPQKPRYFNRVHTGFDWNKYNQTHYDMDNPPPKIVQGYRFNIFYPDLIDPTRTPTFTLTECEDPDFAILRFRAGPPYEDIAFKIVNRGEWETNHKHGYKAQFANGVFQLWFFFKRYRYRR